MVYCIFAISLVLNYVRKWSNYVWYLQSVAKDCLVLSQYDLHRDSFLLVTPIVMSSYKSIIIHYKSTFLWWHAVLSKLGSK